jgi:cytidylate kinase
MTTQKIEESLFNQFVTEQVEKMALERSRRLSDTDTFSPVITVSIQPGSGGRIIAERIAKHLDFDFFNREIIQEVAKSVKISPEVIEKIEKERMFGVEDLVASFMLDNYLWPGMYLEHLESVVLAIGDLGKAVIVGRGANFVLPAEKRFSLRVVAPLEMRVQNIMDAYGVSEAKAKRRIKNRQERRKAFIKKSFNADVDNPLHYDLMINTGALSIDEAVDAVCTFFSKKYKL